MEIVASIGPKRGATGGQSSLRLNIQINDQPRAEPAKTVSLVRGGDIEKELEDLRGLDQEYLVCFTLDAAMMIINRRTVAIGTQNTVYTDPRQIFYGAVSDRAAYVVIAHNHPSGTLRPSKGDITTTQKLAAAGQILGISLLDHIIITKKGSFSFAANGLVI